MFFGDPILDSRYSLYLVFHKTMYIDHSWPQLWLPLQPVFISNKLIDHSWPNMDSRYNMFLIFDKTMFLADPNLDSR